MQTYSGKFGKISMIFYLLFLLLTGVAAEPVELSVDEAVKMALSNDSRGKSAVLDARVSASRTVEVSRSRYPSININGSYTRLSDISSELPPGKDSQNDVVNFSANMQYPVFTGFRVKETLHLTNLQALGKDIAVDIVKQSIEYETRQVYWEAVRSTYNIAMLEENLSLTEHNREITQRKFDEGTVLQADLLSAQMRFDQARMDLEDARMYCSRAFLNLQSLIGNPEDVNAGEWVEPEYIFTSRPEEYEDMSGLGESELISRALNNRPETRSATLVVDMAESNLKITKGKLYPTVSLTGNYTFAKPNSRVAAFQSEPGFTGTWSVGAVVSYDLGGIPSNLAAINTDEMEIKKSKLDLDARKEGIIRDVRNCIITYRQMTRDVVFVSEMLAQAAENERVIRQRVETGMASDTDQLKASLGRLQSEFAIINKQIDLQIAIANLERSLGFDEGRQE